jgi:TPR repeat protein
VRVGIECSVAVLLQSEQHNHACLEDLASSGSAPAQNSLGAFAIKEGNFVDAFEYFRLAAEESHYHPAEFNLGCCYEEGKGTEDNRETALSYFRRSAEASFPPALYKLGLYHESLGEVERAKELYRSGAELNHAPCQFKFGYLHEMIGDYLVACEYYQKAAAQDFSPAQHHLALLYLNLKASPPLSLSPTPSPIEAARSLLLSCALRNYPPSHFILATELNHDPSVHLLEAASLRYGPALAKLGTPRDGSLWTEESCVEINQPDFPCSFC